MKNHTKLLAVSNTIHSYLREIVYGGIDGTITTFAVVAGFTGANLFEVNPTIPVSIVVLFGFANLFADAVSMGLGDLMAMRAEEDVYKAVYNQELAKVSHMDTAPAVMKKISSRLRQKHFSENERQEIIEVFSRHPRFAVEWMMHEYHSLPDPGGVVPWKGALVTFCSFLSFGLIPITPFLFQLDNGIAAFQLSVSGVIVSLVLLGVLRWRVVGNGLARSLGETLLLGSLSALIAFGVGVVIK